MFTQASKHKTLTRRWIGWITFFFVFSALTACVPGQEKKDEHGGKPCKASNGKDAEHGKDDGHDNGKNGDKDEDCDSSGTADGGSTTPASYQFPDLPGRVCTVDKFVQDKTSSSLRKVDILFVMDHSGSMQDDWERVANNMQELVRDMPADVDIRYSVLLADVGSQKGRLYAPLGYPVVLDNQKMKVQEISQKLHKTFVEAMKVSDASGEASFYSLYKAVTTNALDNQRLGFFRADAALSIIFMSDEQEAGFPFPNPQAPGLPPRCDAAYEDGLKNTYYDKQGVNLDVAFNAVKKLKGDMPVVTHAFVNITKEDLFKRNSKNASCLYDSLGYGYFEMVGKTKGVLFSLQANRAEGMARCGQVTYERMNILHDFKLSKPAEKVDASTILAAVDGALQPYTYSASADSVHLDNAGVGGSVVEIRHCEPDSRVAWNLTGFAGTTGQTNANLAFTTAEYATTGKVRWGLTATALSNETAFDSATTTHNIAVAGLTPNTLYYFQAVANDEFGQQKSSAVISLRTRPDWNVSGVSAQPSRNSAAVGWKTAEYPTIGKVRYGADSANLVNESAATAAANDHNVTISNLQANTDYYYQVVSQDEYGLEKTGSVSVMHTVTDWGIIGFAGTPATTSVALAWQTPEFATNGKVLYGTDAANLSQQSTDGVSATSHGLTVTGLTPNTTYYFQVQASDSLGAEKSSAVIAVTTLVDWNLTGFAGTSTVNSVHVAWNTAEYATSGKVLWGTASDALTNAQGDGVNGTSHGVDIANLNADTLYYFQAVSKDDLGREKQSAVIAIRTQPQPVTPPTLPVWDISDLGGVASETSVTVNWNTSGYATTGQVLYGTTSGSLTGNVTESGSAFAHSVTVSGLAPDTIYYFQVVVTDDQGQQKTTAEIPVRTLAQATDPGTGGTPIPAWDVAGFDGTTTGNSATMIWQTPGVATKATLKVGLSATDLSLQVITIDSAAQAQLTTVTGLTADTPYYFQVIAVDSAGTTHESVVIMKRTKAQ